MEDNEPERSERLRGYRDELFQSLLRAYDMRRQAPAHSLQLLRQAAEGLCYCTLLAKNRLGLEEHPDLNKLIQLSAPFLKADQPALDSLREWGNRASHAQGRPDKATVEAATAMFLLTASPMRWLYREILREPAPPDLEERYHAITHATRMAPALEPVSREPEKREPVRAQVASVPSSSIRGVVLVALALLGLAGALTYFLVSRDDGASARASRVSPTNDGVDANRPILPAADLGFVDARGGWGWGDKCWNSIKAKRWGWAKAECDEGLRMNPASPQPRASLLYNEGLIAKERGRVDEARMYFAESLALRENSEVRAALSSVSAP